MCFGFYFVVVVVLGKGGVGNVCGPHKKHPIIDEALPMMTTRFVQGDIWDIKCHQILVNNGFA